MDNNFDKHNNNNDNFGNRKKWSLLSYISVAIIGGIIGSFMMAAVAPNYIYKRVNPVPQGSKTSYTQSQAKPIVLNTTENLNIASAVAQKVMPAVVGISTIIVQQDVFGFGKTMEEIGSGVIIHSDGYILTNSHVVADNPKSITVFFMDGRQMDGQVLWQDTGLDLAVVKVAHDDFATAELGDSSKIVVGEAAVAIGNPLGFSYERTVTQGIISGLNRSIWVSETELMEDLIQTDAAINPGNSGGPLINSKGQVIGINTIKAESAEGLGFAIPINVAKPVVDKFIKQGSFTSTYIGVKLLDSEFASIYYPQIQLRSGILVSDIIAGSPADKEGMQVQDIITDIDGIPTNCMIDFKTILYSKNPGDEVNVTYIRNGETHTKKITLVEKPEEFK